MKRLATITLVAALAFAAGIVATRWWTSSADRPDAGTASTPAATKTWYTCGMHPEVVREEPGTCPKCEMNLVPMSPDRARAMGLTTEPKAEAEPADERKVLYWKSSMIPGETHAEPGKDSMGMDLVPVYQDDVSAGGTIRINPVVEQNMGVRVDKVVRAPLQKAVRTVGFVDYDETSLATVTTKVAGWVEKLYVDQTGVQVHKGEPLFELYSPELFSAQEEYLAALRNLQEKDVAAVPRSRIDSAALVRDARTRLEFFDISPEQITQLEKTRQTQKTLTIRAPFTGIAISKNVVEGQKIQAGVEIFRIADLSTIWVIAKIYEYDLPFVQLGQEAFMTLTYLPGQTFRGRVTYVYPYLNEKTREISARMEFHNPGYQLKPGMFATVTLRSELRQDAVLVPDVAVIDTGLRSVVFTVPQAGRYEAREVKIGRRGADNRLEVLSGLAPGDTVVVSGQFLLDSESRLREAALKFMPAGEAEGASPIEAVTRTHTDHEEEGSTEGDLFYVCPMPEHTDILYDEPGNCPLCGMELVPVRRRRGHVESPPIAHWTCPMPEHAQVREAGPGKCPICGMSLIPVPETKSDRGAARPATAGTHPH